MQIVEIAGIIERKLVIPLVDVRSEGEFLQGHIPWSINIPLLNNEERVKVGTCYKENGNEAAVILGYELVGVKFADIIKQVKTICHDQKVILHCWRGGLRSRIVAQLMENAGFEVFVVNGGYKSFRNWVLNLFEQELNLNVIGGLTGSGKTELLHLLQNSGAQVIDLEGLAHHRGSAFGGINQPAQPSQEDFENKLAEAISHLNPGKTIWIEDESRMVGTNCIPLPLWQTIRNAVLYEIEVPYDDRLGRILNEYAVLPVEKLKERTGALKKRLGDKHLKEVMQFLEDGDMIAWAKALLSYYDKNYTHGQSKRLLDSRKKIILEQPMNGKEFLRKVKV